MAAGAAVARPVRVVILERAVGSALRIAERVFAFLALSAFCGTLNIVLDDIGVLPGGMGGIAVKALVMLPIYGLAAAVLILRPLDALRAVGNNTPVILLLVLTLASTLWSAEPALTLRRTGTLAATCLVGLYLAMRFSPRDLLVLVAWALGAVAVSSVAYVVLMPYKGISEEFAGAWRGIYPHKQMLGMHMALATVVFVLLALGRPRGRWRAWLGAGACAGLVLLSRSSASLLVMVAALAVLPLLHLLRQRSPAAMALGTFALLLGASGIVFLVSRADAVLVALGKDASLTGRIPLWRFVVERIGERPWLGYGYFGFWSGWNGPSAAVSDVTGYWYPYHAHNGLLQLALDTGLLGVLLFLAGYAVAMARTFRDLDAESWADGVWPAAYLTLLLVISTGETVLLRPNTVFTAVFVAVAFAPVGRKWRRR